MPIIFRKVREIPMKTIKDLKQIDWLQDDADELMSLEPAQLRFLVRLPMLLNSSLDSQHVIVVALESLRNMIGAEAVTVFTLSKTGKELIFWALHGEECDRLR